MAVTASSLLQMDETKILMYDIQSHKIVDWCIGPNPVDGSCPRVVQGSPVACANRCIARVTDAGIGHEYTVPEHMSLCPLTLAQSMGMDTDEDSILNPLVFGGVVLSNARVSIAEPLAVTALIIDDANYPLPPTACLDDMNWQ